MSFKSAIVDRDVKNAIQSSTSSSEVAPPNKPELVEQSFRLAAVTPLQVDQPQQINLVDLDLMVPPTGKPFGRMIIGPSYIYYNFLGYLYNRETSDEDEEANECLLQL